MYVCVRESRAPPHTSLVWGSGIVSGISPPPPPCLRKGHSLLLSSEYIKLAGLKAPTDSPVSTGSTDITDPCYRDWA